MTFNRSGSSCRVMERKTRMYEYHVRCDGGSGKVVSVKWAVPVEVSVEVEDQVGRGGRCLSRKEKGPTVRLGQ